MRADILLAIAIYVFTSGPSAAIRHIPPENSPPSISCETIMDLKTLVAYLIRSEEKPAVAESRARKYLEGRSVPEARNDICEK